MPEKYNLRKIENKITSGKTLTEEEENFLAGKVEDYWKNHPDVDNRFPRWKKYMAWVAGYQLFDYNKISKKLVEVPLARKRRLIFNKLRPFVRVLLSKLTAEVHQVSTIPNTTEEEDIEAARIGDLLADGLGRKMKLVEQTNKAKLWLTICNRAFFRVLWDRESYGIIGYDKDPETGELFEVREDGDVLIESVPPFNCRVDPLYYDRRKWRWFLYGEEVDAEPIEEEYDLEKGSLKEEYDVFDQVYGLELQDEQDVMVGTPDKRETISGRTVVWKELWTPKIFAFIAGGKTVDYGVNEWEEIPFYDMEERLVPSDNYDRSFAYNESMIKDFIPVQREYNRQASIMSIAMDRASKLKVLVPLGSLLSKKQWSNDYGVFIDYNRNKGDPYQMKMDALPADIHLYKQHLEREMESVFNLHPSSFGQLPERASHASGTLVNLLLEQDDVVLNPMLNSINDALSGAWSLALRIVQNNYSTSRLVKCVGENNEPYVIKFRGADLRGNTDVKVTTQSGLPRSRALRIEYLMRLRSEGLLQDDKSTLEMLEFGNAEKVFEDQLMHERVAYRENAQLEDNPELSPEEVQSWIYPLEDSSAHLKIHLRFRFSAKYDKLLPQVKELLEMHIQATQQKIQQEQEAQMQQEIEYQRALKGEGESAG